MSTAPPAGQRILVVDDEPDITALVAYHLAKASYRVTTAANGRDALRAAREERPDLIILDLMLPGLSGYEVLAELRRQEETKDVGVIVLTARKDEPDRIKGLSLAPTTTCRSRFPRPSWCCASARCCDVSALPPSPRAACRRQHRARQNRTRRR
jgi:CheY-like chemotaxis protein